MQAEVTPRPNFGDCRGFVLTDEMRFFLLPVLLGSVAGAGCSTSHETGADTLALCEPQESEVAYHTTDSGTPLRWANPYCLGVSIEDPTVIDPRVVQASLDEWNAAADLCAGPCFMFTTSSDAQVVISAGPGLPEELPALTTVQFSQSIGELAGAKIQVRLQSTDGTDALQSTLSHELGHALGLDHSSNRDLIMSGSIPDGRRVQSGDLEAVCALYTTDCE